MSVLYAVGDVHGRRDLLEALLKAIYADAAARDAAPRIVFLGDVIDRGPQSRQVLALVIGTLRDCPGSALILGNHEEFMLRFLDETANREQIARQWFANGGLETLESYGFGKQNRIETIAARFKSEFADHITVLREAEWMVKTARYCFVHGGIDPALPLDGQDPETTRWIRQEFLDHKGGLERIVVHGHTPTASSLPEVYAHRIALDTGAVFSGHLTCAILDDEGLSPPRFLATDDHGEQVEVAEVRPRSFL
jgi:serine/threonine protein phosphatase 1